MQALCGKEAKVDLAAAAREVESAAREAAGGGGGEVAVGYCGCLVRSLLRECGWWAWWACAGEGEGHGVAWLELWSGAARDGKEDGGVVDGC